MSIKRALVVDDSKTMVEMIKFTLEKNGWKVVTALDAEEALKILNKNTNLNFIITDINMPGTNGIELIKMIKKKDNFKDLPILVITTEGGDSTKNLGKTAGANGWITKPFTPNTLMSAVETLHSKFSS